MPGARLILNARTFILRKPGKKQTENTEQPLSTVKASVILTTATVYAPVKRLTA